jgi:nitroreductase
MSAPFNLEETDRLLTTTRAVRRRLDLERPVERELLLDCIRVSQQAPTGSNSQSWRWLVVTDAAKRSQLAEIYRKGRPAFAMSRAGMAADDLQTQRVYDWRSTCWKCLIACPPSPFPVCSDACLWSTPRLASGPLWIDLRRGLELSASSSQSRPRQCPHDTTPLSRSRCREALWNSRRCPAVRTAARGLHLRHGFQARSASTSGSDYLLGSLGLTFSLLRGAEPGDHSRRSRSGGGCASAFAASGMRSHMTRAMVCLNSSKIRSCEGC